MTRVLVCGSRNYRDCPWVQRCVGKLSQEAVLVVGGANGPDKWAEEQALADGLTVVVYPADWERYGKWAGYKRNIEMLNTKPDLVLAFWDGRSKGTAHTIQQAVRRGISVVIWDETRRKHSANYYGF